jgi:hypothetical protein
MSQHREASTAGRPDRSNGPDRAHRFGALVGVLLLVALFALPMVPGNAGRGSPPVPSSLAGHAPAAAGLPATMRSATDGPAATPAATVRPADPTDAFNCFQIVAYACISVQNGSPNVIPTPGNTTSNVLPFANLSISFYVKSQIRLDWIGAPTACNNITPLRLNVTGVLWNGDPYMSRFDGTMWNANVGTPCFTAVSGVTNKTYPYWYSLIIHNNSNGVPLFYPGEYVSWWVYIVNKTGTMNYTHLFSPIFHYRLAQAWAYSPYKGSFQYAGDTAGALDLGVTQSPVLPNWNDTVKIVIRTTPADVLNNCTIGSAYVDVAATLPSGVPLPNLTLNYLLNVPAGYGANYAAVSLPRTYSQVAGTAVSYTVVAFDALNPTKYARDQIRLGPYVYQVGGNGSFINGQFTNDIQVTFDPTIIGQILPGEPNPVFAPGTNVTILLTSANPGTSLLTAEVSYVFQLPSIHEQLSGTIAFQRLNSTNLKVQLPQLPLGAYLNFTVLVWDYLNALETSPSWGYSILTLSDAIPTVDPNLGFFWIYVFDNQSQSWVTGAQYTITASGGYIDIEGRTAFGVAYPNASAGPFSPLLLPVNTTYNITITDAAFIPAGARLAEAVSVKLTLHNPMGPGGTLAQGSDYTVVQAGNELFFWLNSSAPGPTYSPAPAVSASLLIPTIGLAAAVLAVAPLLWWWSDIARRRKEQEKRVTL